MIKTFNDLEFNTHPAGEDFGLVSRLMFENGFGVSVVISNYTYGGSEGLYEVGILDSNGHLTYTTPVADDVIGYLTPDKVSKIMKDVQELVKITDDTVATDAN